MRIVAPPPHRDGRARACGDLDRPAGPRHERRGRAPRHARPRARAPDDRSARPDREGRAAGRGAADGDGAAGAEAVGHQGRGGADAQLRPPARVRLRERQADAARLRRPSHDRGRASTTWRSSATSSARPIDSGAAAVAGIQFDVEGAGRGRARRAPEGGRGRARPCRRGGRGRGDGGRRDRPDRGAAHLRRAAPDGDARGMAAEGWPSRPRSRRARSRSRRSCRSRRRSSRRPSPARRAVW